MIYSSSSAEVLLVSYSSVLNGKHQSRGFDGHERARLVEGPDVPFRKSRSGLFMACGAAGKKEEELRCSCIVQAGRLKKVEQIQMWMKEAEVVVVVVNGGDGDLKLQ